MTKGMTPENGVCYVAARSLWHWKSQPDFNWTLRLVAAANPITYPLGKWWWSVLVSLSRGVCRWIAPDSRLAHKDLMSRSIRVMCSFDYVTYDVIPCRRRKQRTAFTRWLAWSRLCAYFLTEMHFWHEEFAVAFAFSSLVIMRLHYENGSTEVTSEYSPWTEYLAGGWGNTHKRYLRSLGGALEGSLSRQGVRGVKQGPI
jgi:hypothetical protein